MRALRRKHDQVWLDDVVLRQHDVQRREQDDAAALVKVLVQQKTQPGGRNLVNRQR
jgi:hypothetical protein